MKDWTGNKKSTYVTLGASNHSDGERERETIIMLLNHKLLNYY